jgi:hypothetical protein
MALTVLNEYRLRSVIRILCTFVAFGMHARVCSEHVDKNSLHFYLQPSLAPVCPRRS